MNLFSKSGLIIAIICTVNFSFAATGINAVYGYLEPIIILPSNTKLEAKLDTGAFTSSISAINIKIYKNEKDHGKEYVKFNFSHPKIEKQIPYNLPLESKVSIKNRSGEHKKEKYTIRPLVKMKICFDGQLHELNINLTDRTEFDTPILLGRQSLIKLNAVVDPSTKNTIAPCSEKQLNKQGKS
jgi:hypothetical protein